jgi:hypothetical protein
LKRADTEGNKLNESLSLGVVDVWEIHDGVYQLFRQAGDHPLILLFGEQDPSPVYPPYASPFFMIRDAGMQGENADTTSFDDTKKIVEEIESIRRQLPRDSVIILEAGEGPTVGSAYRETYPENVLELLDPLYLPESGSGSGDNEVRVGEESSDLYLDLVMESLQRQVIGYRPDVKSIEEMESGEENRKDQNKVKKALIHVMTAIAVILGL